MIVAASMSSYGEGTYSCKKCGNVRPDLRPASQLDKKDWQVHCPNCQKIVKAIATNEDAKQNSNSIYAITKKNQEEMILTVGRAYGLPAVALRFFNVYGPNEHHKNKMSSVIFQAYNQIINNGKVRLFKSINVTYPFLPTQTLE